MRDIRRLFIIRKDLYLSAGKLAAMVSHCAELYWLNWFKSHTDVNGYTEGFIDQTVFDNYINGIYTKTICAARNKSHLLKAKTIATDLGLIEGIDFGELNDYCLTELEPENEDGTTLVGIWFKPLKDETAHAISKTYQLYRE